MTRDEGRCKVQTVLLAAKTVMSIISIATTQFFIYFMDTQSQSLVDKMALFDVIDVEEHHQCVTEALLAIVRHPDLVNQPNAAGWTSLQVVISVWVREADRLVLVPALLRAGADAQIPAQKGRVTPVHEAARLGYLEIFQLLLDNDPTSAELVTTKGKKPLHYACESESRNMDFIALLVDQQVDLHALTVDGNNCLHYCGAVQWHEAFTFLEAQDVDGHVRNHQGYTAYGKLYADDIRRSTALLRRHRHQVLSQIDGVRVLQLKPVGSEQEFLDEMTEQRPEEWQRDHLVFSEAFRSFRAEAAERSRQSAAQPQFQTER